MASICIHGRPLDVVCPQCDASHQSVLPIPATAVAPDPQAPIRQAIDLLEPDAVLSGSLTEQIELSKAISLRRIADTLQGIEMNTRKNIQSLTSFEPR